MSRVKILEPGSMAFIPSGPGVIFFKFVIPNAAINAARRGTTSTVLLGQRRMGKTEIFKRVVNRLFFEQDPKSPDAVITVYYSFPDARTDERRFAKDYVENFMRFYVGFHTRRPEFVRDAPRRMS